MTDPHLLAFQAVLYIDGLTSEGDKKYKLVRVSRSYCLEKRGAVKLVEEPTSVLLLLNCEAAHFLEPEEKCVRVTKI